jgi:hypothetical protein
MVTDRVATIEGTRVGQATFRSHRPMDEKTLNLWRQIESSRRRTSRQAAVPPTAAPSPERQGAKS